MKETQLQPRSEATKTVNKFTGRTTYPMEYYYRVEIENGTPGARIYRYKLNKNETTYMIYPEKVEVYGGSSFFRSSGIAVHPVGSLDYRAIIALFNGLEADPPFWTNLGTWKNMISSMEYLNKLSSLNAAQRRQAELVYMYAPPE